MSRLRNIDALSDDAKAVAAGWFGFMEVGGKLTFAMVENEPTPRAAAGLDELVAKNVLSVRRRDDGTVAYTLLMDCAAALNWLGRNVDNASVDFALTQPKVRQ